MPPITSQYYSSSGALAVRVCNSIVHQPIDRIPNRIVPSPPHAFDTSEEQQSIKKNDDGFPLKAPELRHAHYLIDRPESVNYTLRLN